jgi:hypothetical protein
MRPSLVVVLLAVLVPVASYAGAPPQYVPGPCERIGTPPASATIPQPAISALISLAMCEAELRFDALRLTPDDASMIRLNEAAKPSFALLDQAIQSHDPVLMPAAMKARRDLYVAMAVRMRNSIPPITSTTVGPALAAHDEAHDELERKLTVWLGAAR